jgi:Mg-chelatase subunit ChlD
MHLLYCAVLFFAVSSQEQTGVQTSQSFPDRKSVQVFLVASGKHDSPAMMAQSEVSVSVDKQPAQVETLRTAKDDALLFAVVVDTSNSAASGADWAKKAALQLFQGLSTHGNQGYLVLFDHSLAMSARPLQVSQVQRVLDATKFNGGTAIYDAIEQLAFRNSADRVTLILPAGELF